MQNLFLLCIKYSTRIKRKCEWDIGGGALSERLMVPSIGVWALSEGWRYSHTHTYRDRWPAGGRATLERSP